MPNKTILIIFFVLVIVNIIIRLTVVFAKNNHISYQFLKYYFI